MERPRARSAAWILSFLAAACGGGSNGVRSGGVVAGDGRAMERDAMVDGQIAARGVDDPAVLAAMREVPRHLFVPEPVGPHAYADAALPIGHDQTISQPFVVAYMTQALRLEPDDRVLEIGTGSGYQAAVLANVAGQVYTIEIVEDLARQAADRLRRLGYDNVHVRAGDGFRGWPEEAPFDAVLLTAAPAEIPEPLLDQVAVGGRLVAPVGDRDQWVKRITRTEEGYEEERLIPVRFVPMTGEAQER